MRKKIYTISQFSICSPKNGDMFVNMHMIEEGFWYDDLNLGLNRWVLKKRYFRVSVYMKISAEFFFDSYGDAQDSYKRYVRMIQTNLDKEFYQNESTADRLD